MSVTAGILDPTFSGQPAPAYQSADGQLTLTSVYGTAIAPNGDIVIAGTGDAGVDVVRLLPNGAPDTSFGDGGFETFGADVTTMAGVVVAPNGNVLVALNDGAVAEGEIVSFPASGGAATETVQAFDPAATGYASQVNAIALLPNGDVAIVGEGQAVLQGGGGGPREFAVACLVANTLQTDTSFHYTGAQTTYLGLTAVAPALNGGLAVAGSPLAGGAYVALLTASGSVNTSFTPDLSHAGSPLAADVAGVFSVAVTPDGKVDLVSTDPNTNADVTRFTASGALDTTFNSTGYREIDLFYPRSAYVQSDGKLVLGGTDGNHDNVAVIRLDANGSSDATFGPAGTGEVDVGPQYNATYVNTMAVDGDGRIVIAGDNLVDTGSGDVNETGLFRLLPGEYAYPSTAVTIPGTVFAASYDDGGEGVAYHDTDDVNAYASPGREDGVDISSTGTSVGHGIVGYAYPGEYLKYTVTVATAGTYAVSILGGNVFGTGGTYHLEDTNGTHLTGELTAATASLSAYTTFSAGTVTLTAGTHVLKLSFDTGGAHGLVMDLDDLTFAAVAAKGTVTGTVSGGPAGETVFLDANNNGSYDTGEPTTTTNSTGAYTFTSIAPGSYVVRQELATTTAQALPAAGAGVAVTVTAGGTVAGASFTDATLGTKLTGSAIGTAGSFGNGGNTIAKALDGSLTTFFDGPTASGDTVGLDLGKAYDLTGVAFASRPTYASRMDGGTFQASNSATFATGNVTLYTIPATANPTGTALALQAVSGSYRYVRYVAPADGYGDVSEVQFFGTAASTTPTSSKLAGTAIGTAGSYGNSGNTIVKALDGNLTTFFDGPTPSGDTVGLDLGSATTITSLAYASRSGWASRMNGGSFQASNSSTFATGNVTLYTIAANANPSSTALTTQAVSVAGTYRYVRYVAPANSYGDVAEVQFFGYGGAVTPTPTRLTGTTSGTAGSYGNGGNTVAGATDGSLTTFFDGPTASGDVVVIDLGSAKTVSQIAFAPRSGWAGRMVGGVFQASNSSTFASGVVTVYTVGSTPATGALTTVTTGTTTAYRYWRYVAPANSYGDIAEFELFG
jgi:uncharacterized delta-60 repeat protein